MILECDDMEILRSVGFVTVFSHLMPEADRSTKEDSVVTRFLVEV